MRPNFVLSHEPIYVIFFVSAANKFGKRHKRRYTKMYNKKNMTRLFGVKKLYY